MIPEYLNSAMYPQDSLTTITKFLQVYKQQTYCFIALLSFLQNLMNAKYLTNSCLLHQNLYS
jgi:hypothetical protein